MTKSRKHEEIGARAWEAVLRTQAQILRRLEAEVQVATGLPLSWYDVLLELSRAEEERLRMTELGERVVLSRSRVSRVVDAMARAGLVVKDPDPDDGRVALATMTPTGKASLRRAAPIYLEGIRREFSRFMTEAELLAIVTNLSKVIQAEDEIPKS